MGKLVHKRLPAATIVETMVAMVIILVIFGITTAVLVQTSVHSFSLKKIKAAELTNTYFMKTANEKAFITEEIELEGFKIRKTVQPYDRNNHIMEVSIIILDNNDKELQNEQRLIRQQ